MARFFKRCMWTIPAMIFSACLPPKADEASLNTAGIGSYFSGALPTPKPKPSESLRTLVKNIGQRSLASARMTSTMAPQQILQKSLIESVSEVGGLPRWQIRHALIALLDPSSSSCGGVSCSRIFKLSTDDVDSFLDETYKRIESQSSYWNDAAKKQQFNILLSSFQRDYARPFVGAPNTPIKFKNPAISAAFKAQLPEGVKTVTIADLSRITTLDIVLHTLDRPAASLDLEDLLQLPKLRELRIATDSLEAISAIARSGDNLHKISFSWTQRSGEIPKVRDFEILSSLPKLYDLKLAYTSLEDADQLARTLPRIRHFIIDRPMTKVTEETLRQVAAMPSLRHVGLHGISYDDLGSMTMSFPKKVVSAEYVSSLKPRDSHQLRIDRCGDLGHFRIFAEASTMKVQGCQVRAISGFGRPLAWQILSLKDCVSETGAPIKLNPSREIANLRVFDNDGSPTLDIDDLTRQEITARLAYYGGR